MRKLALIAALAALVLGGCATNNLQKTTTIGGQPSGDKPTTMKSVAGIPANQSSYHYSVLLYPGIGDKFDPNPALTLEEYNAIVQLDFYCAKKADELSGRWKEMFRHGTTYGILQGIFTALGAQWGFGSAISAGDYFKYAGAAGFGGGLASGQITFEQTLSIAHGYCMTGMVYKADELEDKLKRVFIVPTYAGNTPLPKTSDKSAPDYPNAKAPWIPPR